MVPHNTVVAVKAKPKAAKLFFSDAASCDHFVFKCSEYDSLWVTLETGKKDDLGAPLAVRFDIKVKHDEPFEVCKRKRRVTLFWESLCQQIAAQSLAQRRTDLSRVP